MSGRLTAQLPACHWLGRPSIYTGASRTDTHSAGDPRTGDNSLGFAVRAAAPVSPRVPATALSALRPPVGGMGGPVPGWHGAGVLAGRGLGRRGASHPRAGLFRRPPLDPDRLGLLLLDFLVSVFVR